MDERGKAVRGLWFDGLTTHRFKGRTTLSKVEGLPSSVRASKSKALMAIVLVGIVAANCGYCEEIAFFVSPQGNDTYPGTKAQPFKTLEAARDAVRKSDHSRMVIVWLRGGGMNAGSLSN
jgi:hypothetical protein